MGGRDSGYKEKGKLFSPEEKQIPLEDKKQMKVTSPEGMSGRSAGCWRRVAVLSPVSPANLEDICCWVPLTRITHMTAVMRTSRND